MSRPAALRPGSAGMGYLGAAAFLIAAEFAVALIFELRAEKRRNSSEKELKITIPENLDYSGIFDDLFERYTVGSELIRVKTVNMGSLYELIYHVVLKDNSEEKSFLDELRCRNGNLQLICGRVPQKKDEL